MTAPFDELEFIAALEQFGGSRQERLAVARQARDLYDSGKVNESIDGTMTTTFLISELSDAPSGTPADRWNWWIGAMNLAYGNFSQFQVRQWKKK